MIANLTNIDKNVSVNHNYWQVSPMHGSLPYLKACCLFTQRQHGNKTDNGKNTDI